MTATLALICALLAGCTVAAPRTADQDSLNGSRRTVIRGIDGLPSGAPQYVSGPVVSHSADRIVAVPRGGAPLTLAGGTSPQATNPRESSITVARGASVTGIASWFAARGYQGAVPWWKAGQEPVWATVSRFADGKTYSVTLLITGFCQCLVGQPGERVIDLSPAAFRSLGAPLSVGLIRVTMTVPVQGPRLPATDSLP